MASLSFDPRELSLEATTKRWLAVRLKSSKVTSSSLENNSALPRLCWGDVTDPAVEQGFELLPSTRIRREGKAILVGSIAKEGENASITKFDLDTEREAIELLQACQIPFPLNVIKQSVVGSQDRWLTIEKDENVIVWATDKTHLDRSQARGCVQMKTVSLCDDSQWIRVIGRDVSRISNVNSTHELEIVFKPTDSSKTREYFDYLTTLCASVVAETSREDVNELPPPQQRVVSKLGESSESSTRGIIPMEPLQEAPEEKKQQASSLMSQSARERDVCDTELSIFVRLGLVLFPLLFRIAYEVVTAGASVRSAYSISFLEHATKAFGLSLHRMFSQFEIPIETLRDIVSRGQAFVHDVGTSVPQTKRFFASASPARLRLMIGFGLSGLVPLIVSVWSLFAPAFVKSQMRRLVGSILKMIWFLLLVRGALEVAFSDGLTGRLLVSASAFSFLLGVIVQDPDNLGVFRIVRIFRRSVVPLTVALHLWYYEHDFKLIYGLMPEHIKTLWIGAKDMFLSSRSHTMWGKDLPALPHVLSLALVFYASPNTLRVARFYLDRALDMDYYLNHPSVLRLLASGVLIASFAYPSTSDDYLRLSLLVLAAVIFNVRLIVEFGLDRVASKLLSSKRSFALVVLGSMALVFGYLHVGLQVQVSPVPFVLVSLISTFLVFVSPSVAELVSGLFLVALFFASLNAQRHRDRGTSLGLGLVFGILSRVHLSNWGWIRRLPSLALSFLLLVSSKDVLVKDWPQMSANDFAAKFVERSIELVGSRHLGGSGHNHDHNDEHNAMDVFLPTCVSSIGEDLEWITQTSIIVASLAVPLVVASVSNLDLLVMSFPTLMRLATRFMALKILIESLVCGGVLGLYTLVRVGLVGRVLLEASTGYGDKWLVNGLLKFVYIAVASVAMRSELFLILSLTFGSLIRKRIVASESMSALTKIIISAVLVGSLLVLSQALIASQGGLNVPAGVLWLLCTGFEMLFVLKALVLRARMPSPKLMTRLIKLGNVALKLCGALGFCAIAALDVQSKSTIPPLHAGAPLAAYACFASAANLKYLSPDFGISRLCKDSYRRLGDKALLLSVLGIALGPIFLFFVGIDPIAPFENLEFERTLLGILSILKENSLQALSWFVYFVLVVFNSVPSLNRVMRARTLIVPAVIAVVGLYTPFRIFPNQAVLVLGASIAYFVTSAFVGMVEQIDRIRFQESILVPVRNRTSENNAACMMCGRGFDSNDLQDKSNPREELLFCQHVFHESCIADFEQARCPVCFTSSQTWWQLLMVLL